MVLSVKKEKPTPLHHRKRQAQHHKRSRDYDKHYWPYLPLLVVAGIGLGLNVFWTPIVSTAKHDVLGYATSTSSVGLLDETNAQRASNGVGSLQINSQLNQAAQAKAEDMITRNYWSHTTPDGKEPWWFVTNAGYNYSTVGENLAYGFISSNATVTGWMNSPGHKANLLNSNFQDVGFGIANSPDYVSNGQQTIVVAMYGKSLAQANTVTGAALTATNTPSAATPVTAAPAAASKAATEQPAAAAATSPDQPAAPAPTAAVTTPSDLQSARVVPSTSSSQLYNTQPARVTRLQTVATSLPAEGMATTILAVAAAGALLIYRHSRAWHRRLVYSEEFIIRHPYLDLILISTVTLGMLLTRTAGFIN